MTDLRRIVPDEKSQVNQRRALANINIIVDKINGLIDGTTSQYLRGDGSKATLNKAAVGLGNVENTALSTWGGSVNLVTAGNLVVSSLDSNGDVLVDPTKSVYWGDFSTNDSWRIRTDGTNLLFDRRVGGAWVNKHTIAG
jgi:hypothetical protein